MNIPRFQIFYSTSLCLGAFPAPAEVPAEILYVPSSRAGAFLFVIPPHTAAKLCKERIAKNSVFCVAEAASLSHSDLDQIFRETEPVGCSIDLACVEPGHRSEVRTLLAPDSYAN